jgi:hypothetical protein
MCARCCDRRPAIKTYRVTRETAVRVDDATRLGVDISGVQCYVSNGAQMVYLGPRVEWNQAIRTRDDCGRCAHDGRPMMHVGSCYCSLHCKLSVQERGVGLCGGSTVDLCGSPTIRQHLVRDDAAEASSTTPTSTLPTTPTTPTTPTKGDEAQSPDRTPSCRAWSFEQLQMLHTTLCRHGLIGDPGVGGKCPRSRKTTTPRRAPYQ